MTTTDNGENADPIDAMFDGAREVERDALYACIARLDEGYSAVPPRPSPRGNAADGPCWLAPTADDRDWHLGHRIPMSEAEATVMRVARLKADHARWLVSEPPTGSKESR